MVKFSHTVFYVKDVKLALKFYEDLFGFKTKFIYEGNHYAEMETGATSLAFISEEFAATNLVKGYIKNDISKPPFAGEVDFTVPDVQEYYDKAIKLGAVGAALPEQKPWGQVIAYVRDHNGILIELSSAMDME